MRNCCFCIAVVLLTQSALAVSVESFTEPYRKIDIAPPETGTLSKLLVREGDRVQAGQVLASLDCEMLEVSLEIAKAAMEARGQLESALAERKMRQSRSEKLDELRTRGHASAEEVERAKTDLAVVEANVRSKQEQSAIDVLEHKKIEAMIERRVMRSPIDGIVSRVYREEREFVPANTPTVLTVVQLDPLRITFSVPTGQAETLKVGQQVRLSFSETSENATGTVELVAPVTEAESGTVRVKVLLPNAKGNYRCGVRCCLELPGDSGGDKPQA